MRKAILFLLAAIVLLPATQLAAQELFTYTEPASNMPARSVGLRLNNRLMEEQGTGRINYHLVPEVMAGVNKRLMPHAEAYISNRVGGGLSYEGEGLYAKYRFYSNDQVFRHFRLAALGRLTANNAAIDQEEIETNGHNTGYQLGLIGTQLLHKTALSVTTYYEQALDNCSGHEFPQYQQNKAINYSLSAGRLLLPKAYTGFKQTNLNVMVEALGQHLLSSDRQYLDIAASVQFIFNSQTRVDIGYKRELYSNMVRTAPDGLLVRVEHLLFHVF